MKAFMSLLIITSGIFYSACVPFVYSPAKNLPSKPLKKKDVQITGTFEYLTQMNPKNKEAATGNAVWVRAGVSDKFTLQVKGFFCNKRIDNMNRYGFTIAPLINISNEGPTYTSLMPEISLLYVDYNMLANVYAFHVLHWFKGSNIFHPYISIGGYCAISSQVLGSSIGLISNPGLTISAGKHIDINLEIGMMLLYSCRAVMSYNPGIGIGIKL